MKRKYPIGLGMGDNVILQSLLIIVGFTIAGGAGAVITMFIYKLLGKVNKADAELDKTRSIQRKIYQVAIDALRGMKATSTLEMYKANYRAFRDAISDAETLQMETAGVWRAQALLDTLSHKEQPTPEAKIRIEKTEEELRRSLEALIEEEDGPQKKTKKTKKK